MLGRETQEDSDIAPEAAAHRRRSRQKAAVAGALGATVLATVFAVVMGGRGTSKDIEVRSPRGVGAPEPPAVPSDSTVVKAGSRSVRPAEIVALSRTEVVLLDSARGRRLRVLAAHPEAADPAGEVFLEGVALSADHRSAYYAVAGPCGEGTVYRVPVDGRAPPERVATGISPAVSPDGSKLAYAAPGGAGPDGRPRCDNRIVVRDLRTGAERTWSYPDDPDPLPLYQDGVITRIAWAPDSTRLAFTLSYEGDSVSILDTVVDRDLSESKELVVPGGGGDSRHPTWQASSGRVAVVNSAFECCFADNYTGPTRTLLVDPDKMLSEDLLPPGKKPAWLDFDVTGHHLLYVDGDRLYRRSGSGSPVAVGRGYVAADW
jgi:hypothetical protein